MDKTFEDIITETLEDLSSNNNQEETVVEDNSTDTESTPVEENNQDNSSEDVVANTSDEAELENNTDEDTSKPLDLGTEEAPTEAYQKDSQAFARMRTELKEANTNLDAAKSIIQFFDVRAKQMGLNGIKDLMEKTVESELNKQAQEKGIPVDVLRRINELEDKVQRQDNEREALIRNQKEQNINHVFDSFMEKHSLSQNDVSKMANDLVNDGFSFDTLMNMPSSAVTKILNSYLPESAVKQEVLSKKEQVRKEVPVTGNTSSGVNKDDEIDKIAREWVNLGY